MCISDDADDFSGSMMYAIKLFDRLGFTINVVNSVLLPMLVQNIEQLGFNPIMLIWLFSSLIMLIRDNAMIRLSCKFAKSKWNPCLLIMLRSSSGTKYALNEHEDVDQYGSFAIPSEIMLYQSHPESLVKQNENWVVLMSPSGSNYVLNEHEGVDQYGSFAIPSEMIPC